MFEVACLSTNLSSFTDTAWQLAREYDARVIADIEAGVKSWENLSNRVRVLEAVQETVLWLVEDK